MHARRYVHVTFGHQGIQAAWRKRNIRPLKVKNAKLETRHKIPNFCCSENKEYAHIRDCLSTHGTLYACLWLEAWLLLEFQGSFEHNIAHTDPHDKLISGMVAC